MGAHSTGLWDYALSLYAQPAPPDMALVLDGTATGPADVMSACLLLQDTAGLDVCELLWIHWLAARGVTLTAPPTQLLGNVRDWQGWMTQALRERRRQLKVTLATSSAIPDPATTQRLERLYQQLKACELSAEQDTLAQLETLTPPLTAHLPAPFARLDDFRLAFQQSLVQLSDHGALDNGRFDVSTFKISTAGVRALDVLDQPIARSLWLLAESRAAGLKADAELVRGC